MSRHFPVPRTLQGLIDTFGGRLLRGRAGTTIHALATLRSARPDEITFLSSASYLAQARASCAACIVTSEGLAAQLEGECALIVVDDPYGWYARLAQSIAAGAAASRSAPERHTSAMVAPSARLGERVRIGGNAVIEADAVLGDDVSVGPGCVVGAGARLGAATLLHANVTVYHECEIGERGIVHAGAVIGADGFGFAPVGGAWVKIAQLGAVIIGSDVEIGANTAIDRGAIEDTLIGNGCKLDNLIQIAHNVQLGEHCALAGCVGVAGSAIIGARCQFGGGAGVLGHLTICDDVTVSAMSLVTRSITASGFYSGVFPLMRNADWERAAATTRHLPELRQRLRALERLTKDR